MFLVAGLAVTCGVLLFGLEMYLRLSSTPSETPGVIVTHPQRGHALRPNFTGKTYDATLRINSDGLRDYERSVATGEKAVRIAVFGDSITMGIGVELEHTYPKLLERSLNAIGRRSVQVFNFGASSYNTLSEYLYLIESFDRYHPHLVIFEFTAGNDTALLHPPGSPKGINEWALVRWAKDVLRHLYSYNWLAARYYNFYYRRLFERLAHDSFQARAMHDEMLYADNFEGWRDAQHAFSQIADFSRARHVPVLFAIFANNIRLSPEPESDVMYPVVKKVTATLREQGIGHILVLDDVFRRYAGKEELLQIRTDDSHWSVLAHDLAASALLRYIQEHGLLDGGER